MALCAGDDVRRTGVDRTIISYYDRLAPEYDRVRFGASYGRYVDAFERRVLRRWLPPAGAAVLEVGCGTGRLAEFASAACDASVESLRIAAAKRPGMPVFAADAEALPVRADSFDAVFALHVLMHLTKDAARAMLSEAARVVKPGGHVVADILSARRRRWNPPPPSAIGAWHGATAYEVGEIGALAAPFGLTLQNRQGLLALPVHRVPQALRAPLGGVDRALAALAPEWSSYVLLRFRKGQRP
jgi:SAM-dependent methyltransferase